MFSILKILQQRSGIFYFFVVLLGILNSVSQFGIIYLINQTITFKPIPYFQEYSWAAFIGVLIISFVTTTVFQRYLIRMVNDIGYEFNVKIFETVRKSSYQQLEAVSHEKFYTAMDDVDRLSYIPNQLIGLLNSFIIASCGVVYMFSLSFRATVTLLGAIAILITFLVYRIKQIKGQMGEIRELENDFYRYLNDLMSGFREVLMSSSRNNNLHTKFIIGNRRRSRDLRINTSFFYLGNDLANSYGWYIVIGVIVFGISRFSEMGIAGAVAFTMTIFYIMGPIGVLIRFMPTLTRMRISYEHLSKFMEILQSTTNEQASAGNCTEEFQSLKIERVGFEYEEEGNGFAVGPLDIEIRRGDVIFVTGGNGSGKSTFVHLLTGIFKPSEGKIYYNRQEVDTFGPGYRDNIAVIFTDPFLFTYNYEDFRYREVKPDLENYITMLKMNNILKIDYINDTIERKLSKGQQKRLALILALVEKKPIIVMDEWAAEQDPQFRKYFYRNILPALKAEGKTLILITHDDQYFDCADRILKFEYGKIVEPIESSFVYGNQI